MRPRWLKTKIFLDGGDPQETKKAFELLGFLDGQTTNPTLIAKNPEVKKRLAEGKKFTKAEIYEFYRETIIKIATVIPRGSVSIEVYSDADTSAAEMFTQAVEMYQWIPTAHIKFPITIEGLKAARMAVDDYMRVNMTLCFSQEQAAAVHRILGDTRKGRVFISPFIGRLDDIGLRGVDLVANILRMYRQPKSTEYDFGCVEVLGASVRNIAQFLYLLKIETDIITAPFSVLAQWAKAGLPNPDKEFILNTPGLKPIAYDPGISLLEDGSVLNVGHELTDAGLKRFADDWNGLI